MAAVHPSYPVEILLVRVSQMAPVKRDAPCLQLPWTAAHIDLRRIMDIAMLLRIQSFYLPTPKKKIICPSSTIRQSTAPRPKMMWGLLQAFCPVGAFRASPP
jgi:hypothetical protein